MKMDRNENQDGTGKYAVVNLRKFKAMPEDSDERREVRIALEALQLAGVLEWGCVGEPDEFFLIKLKDINAEHALIAYADEASHNGDKEFAGEVYDMARRSGKNSPHCKVPD